MEKQKSVESQSNEDNNRNYILELIEYALNLENIYATSEVIARAEKAHNQYKKHAECIETSIAESRQNEKDSDEISGSKFKPHKAQLVRYKQVEEQFKGPYDRVYKIEVDEEFYVRDVTVIKRTSTPTEAGSEIIEIEAVDDEGNKYHHRRDTWGESIGGNSSMIDEMGDVWEWRNTIDCKNWNRMIKRHSKPFLWGTHETIGVYKFRVEHQKVIAAIMEADPINVDDAYNALKEDLENNQYLDWRTALTVVWRDKHPEMFRKIHPQNADK